MTVFASGAMRSMLRFSVAEAGRATAAARAAAAFASSASFARTSGVAVMGITGSVSNFVRFSKSPPGARKTTGITPVILSRSSLGVNLNL